jgi:dTDP-4-amino-4,6-dideoxygalactose transaminase
MTVPFCDLRAMTEQVRPTLERAWSSLLDGDQFIGGASVERFESAWADYCGAAEAVGVASGTDGLQLTLRALGVGAGDEVVVPGNAFVGIAEAVVLAGAAPRFADVNPHTLLLDQHSFEDAITPRTAAVIAVHLYGQMADMDAICDIATRAGIAVIEDATHAQGATWQGRRAGSSSRAGCFGFGPEANLGALGDAGAVVTSDADLAATIRALRYHGSTSAGARQHVLTGSRSVLDSIQADVLSAKLPHLDAWTAARRNIATRYRLAAGSSQVAFVTEAEEADSVYHLAVVRVAYRDRVRMMLESLGVETRIHYRVPLHLRAPYLDNWVSPLPVVEQAAKEVLSLPMWPHLSGPQVERVCYSLGVVGAMLEESLP